MQESARFGVDRATQKVIRRRVTYVELDRRIEFREFDQIGRKKITCFVWWLSRECLFNQIRHWSQRGDFELSRAWFRTEWLAFVNDVVER